MRSLGHTPTEAGLDALKKELDTDSSGTINLKDFLTRMVPHEEEETNPFKILKAFKKLDENKNGFISINELEEVLKKYVKNGYELKTMLEFLHSNQRPLRYRSRDYLSIIGDNEQIRYMGFLNWCWRYRGFMFLEDEEEDDY